MASILVKKGRDILSKCRKVSRQQKKTWGKFFDLSKEESEQISHTENRRLLLQAIVHTLEKDKDYDLVLYVIEREVDYAKMDLSPDPITRYMESISLVLCAHLLARFKKIDNLFLMWKCMEYHKSYEHVMSRFFLYLLSDSVEKTRKFAEEEIKPIFKDQKDLKKKLLKRIDEDVEYGLTQKMCVEFWEKQKWKGYKIDQLIKISGSVFQNEYDLLLKQKNVGETILLQMINDNSEKKWKALVGYKHQIDESYDYNWRKRALVMIELCKKKYDSSIMKYEEIIYFLQREETNRLVFACGFFSSIRCANWLVIKIGKMENIFRLWRSKCTNFDASICVDAQILYSVGKNGFSLTGDTIEDAINFVRDYKELEYKEDKKSLLERIERDLNNWLSQESIDLWKKRRDQANWRDIIYELDEMK